LIRNHLIDGVDLIDDGSSLLCDSCEYAKFTRKPIKKERVSLADTFGAEIHTDVWGPSPVSSLRDRKYYITFTDDYFRYTRIQLLRKG
jgi:hypothetical protein